MKILTKPDFNIYVLMVLVLITGLFIYKDYGISWDEGMQRKDNGLVNYNYIHNNNYEALINGNEKYHGPAFEIVLIYLEKFTGFKSLRDITFMRHLATFLVFVSSLWFFYRVIYEEFSSKWLALMGTLFLILSPRIFADSFYNSKDLVFMCFIIISTFTALRFLKQPSVMHAMFHGIISGILIDIRVMGIVMPVFTIIIVCWNLAFREKQLKQYYLPVIIYLAVLIPVIILCWPVLWKDPVQQFVKSVEEMSHYHWESYFTYLGKRYDTDFIPWHYIPVWMAVTTPILYILAFIIGVSVILTRLMRSKINEYELLPLMVFFVPLLSVILLKSVVYDGWRHLFFIYPAFLFISIKGISYLNEKYIEYPYFKIALQAGCSIYLLYILIVMIKLHPYENVYFNRIAGSSLNEIRSNFEIDYWGLSYKQALEHIVSSDTAEHIIISPAENPGRDNMRILYEDDKMRLSVTTRVEIADYYLTTYRYQHEETTYPAEYNISRNGVIASVFDLRKDKIQLDDKVLTARFYNSYDTSDSNWNGGKIVGGQKANSGNKCERIDSNDVYSSALWVTPSDIINRGMRNYMTYSLYIKSNDPVDSRLIMNVDSSNGEMIYWDGIDFDFYRPGKWTYLEWKILVPSEYISSNRLKVFLWNYRNNQLLIDDQTVEFFSVPDSMYWKLREKYPLAFYRD